MIGDPREHHQSFRGPRVVLQLLHLVLQILRDLSKVPSTVLAIGSSQQLRASSMISVLVEAYRRVSRRDLAPLSPLSATVLAKELLVVGVAARMTDVHVRAILDDIHGRRHVSAGQRCLGMLPQR